MSSSLEEIELNASMLFKFPITVVAGFCSLICFVIPSFISFLLFPRSFSPLTNVISDLGSVSKNPFGHYFFSIGCILTGMSLIFLFFGFYEWFNNNIRNKIFFIIGQFFGFSLSFSLILIGFVPIDFHIIHTTIALVFFLSIGFLALFMSIFFFRFKESKKVSYFGFVVVLCLFIAPIFVFLLGIEFFEWIVLGLSLSYIVIMIIEINQIIKSWKNKTRKKKREKNNKDILKLID